MRAHQATKGLRPYTGQRNDQVLSSRKWEQLRKLVGIFKPRFFVVEKLLGGTSS